MHDVFAFKNTALSINIFAGLYYSASTEHFKLNSFVKQYLCVLSGLWALITAVSNAFLG